MRVSVWENDPGYREDAHSDNYEAYLDGERVDKCITADEEEGYILRYVTDEDGEFILEEDETTGERYLVTEELYGEVEIRKVKGKMTVYKYPIENFTQIISMPVGSTILSVQSQNNLPTIWALVDPDKNSENRKFRIIGTGNHFDPSGLQYLGTVLVHNDSLVWHIFEDKL